MAEKKIHFISNWGSYVYTADVDWIRALYIYKVLNAHMLVQAQVKFDSRIVKFGYFDVKFGI